MKELLPQIRKWVSEKKPFAIARVIQTWGSSPRPVGSAIIISSDMEMAGSVSGGCVEGAILKEAVQIIENKKGKRLSYGVTDDEAWSVGLTCGGKIQVYLQGYPIDGNHAEVWEKLVASLTENSQCILITSLVDGESKSTLIDRHDTVIGSPVPDMLLAKAREAYAKRTNASVTIGETEYFMQVFARRSQLFIIGAAHITSDLIQLAKLHDFETIVIDPRGTFARQTQFVKAPDQIFEKYPTEVLSDFTLDASTYAVVLSHDPKIDDNALQILLHSKVAYIGALGSRKTHEKRMERLKQSGFSEEEIKRIEAPIGVDIKAQGGREIALSIMASIIRAKNTYL